MKRFLDMPKGQSNGILERRALLSLHRNHIPKPYAPRLMKNEYCLKIQIMIDTKMMANTKKNTPFDIISKIQCDSKGQGYLKLKL